MKSRHERSATRFRVPEAVVRGFASAVDECWRDIERHNRAKLDEGIPIVTVRRSKTALGALRTIGEIAQLIRNSVGQIDREAGVLPTAISAFLREIGYDSGSFDAIPYYKNRFCRWNIHILMYGIPNLFGCSSFSRQ
jgi:hypothetical protein